MASLSSLSLEYNNVICIDHLFMDTVTIFHKMNISSILSAVVVVESTEMNSCIYSCELISFARCCPPSSIHADGAFKNAMFGTFLQKYDIELRPLPPRLHQKNTIESKYGTIRSIFLRLKGSDDKVLYAVLVIGAIRISNNFYGYDTLSSFEMANGFSKPLLPNQGPIPVD